VANLKGGIPPVPQGFSGADKIFLQQLKEGLEVLGGVKGAGSKAVTAKNLVEMGFAKYVSLAGEGEIEPLNNDSVLKLDLIPTPTNLVATAGFENILLSWDLVQYSGHSAVQVFRNDADNIAQATMLAELSGYTKIFSDPVGENATFYYWVRAVNVIGDTGPFNTSVGVSATTLTNNASIIAELSESITDSELAQSLRTPLGKIDGLEDLLEKVETYTGYVDTYDTDDLLTRIGATETVATNAASTAATIETNLSSANTAISNLQTSVGDLTSGTTAVFVQDSEPTGTISTYSRWYDSANNMEPYVRIDANGDGTETWESLLDPRIAANESSITNLNAEVFNADGTVKVASASALSTLDSTVTGINGTVTSHASSITALDGAVFNDDDTVKLATTSALDTLTSSVTAIYDAEDDTSLVKVLQSSVTDLNAEVFAENGDSLLATASALNTLSSTVTSQGGDITTAQSDITSLNSTIYGDDDTLQLATASALSGLQSDVETIYKADSETSLVRVLQSSVDSLSTEVFSEVDGEQVSRLAQGDAFSTLTQDFESAEGDITTLQSRVDSLDTTVYGAVGDTESIVATSAALDTLSAVVDSIYNEDDDETVVSAIQSDITSLDSEVFSEVDGEKVGRLASSSALSTLTSTVEAIYDGDNASTVKSLQGEVTDLNAVVFSDDELALATASALETLDTAVKVIYDPDNLDDVDLIQAIQTSITNLNSEVFTDDGDARLASGSALTTLSSNVTAIYDGDNESLVKSLQTAVTELNSALYDDDSNLKLASASALSQMQTEVFGEGNESGASASLIQSLNTKVNDPISGLEAQNGYLQIFEAEVYGAGGYSPSAVSRVDSTYNAVFDGDGETKLASADSVTELRSELFDDAAEISRIDKLTAEVFTADGDSAFASASFVEAINLEVFGDSTTQENGRLSSFSSKVGTMEQTINTHESLLSDEDGLSAQYSVKVNSDGHVSGFGLATTTNTGLGEELVVDPDFNNSNVSTNFTSYTNGSYTVNQGGLVVRRNSSSYPQFILRIPPTMERAGFLNRAVLEIHFSSSTNMNLRYYIAGVANQVLPSEKLWEEADVHNGTTVKSFNVLLRPRDSTDFSITPDFNQAQGASHSSHFFMIKKITCRLAVGSFSEFAIAADRFALVDPADGSKISPFFVQGGKTYIDSAHIRDGSIDQAKIGSLTVDFVDVTGTLSASKIEGGTLDASVINVDNSTIKEVNGKLSLGKISANSIESGTIDAGNVTIDNLYATSIKGGVSRMTSYRDTTTKSIYTESPTNNNYGNSVAYSGSIGRFNNPDIARRIHLSFTGWGKFASSQAYVVSLFLTVRVDAEDTGEIEIRDIAKGKRDSEPYYRTYDGTAVAYLDGDVEAELAKGWILTSRYDGEGEAHKGAANYFGLGTIKEVEYFERFGYTKVEFDPTYTPSQRGSAGSGYYWHWGEVDVVVARYPNRAERATFGCRAKTIKYKVGEQRFRPAHNMWHSPWAVQGGLEIPTRHFVSWNISFGTESGASINNDTSNEVNGLIMELR